MLRKLFLVFILFSSCLSQVGAQSTKQDSLDELLVLSGTKSQINDLLMSIKGIAGSQASSGESSSVSAIEKLINPDILMTDIRKSLEGAMTQDEMQMLIDWYSSNLGNRIARAEERAAQPDMMMEVQKQAVQLATDDKRMALARKLVDASGFYEKSTDSQTVMTLIAEAVAAKSKDDGNKIDIELVKSMIEQQQDAMKLQLENFLQILVAYTYQDFSADEISKYIVMLKSPAMSKFNQLGQQATLGSIEKMVRIYVNGE